MEEKVIYRTSVEIKKMLGFIKRRVSRHEPTKDHKFKKNTITYIIRIDLGINKTIQTDHMVSNGFNHMRWLRKIFRCRFLPTWTDQKVCRYGAIKTGWAQPILVWHRNMIV